MVVTLGTDRGSSVTLGPDRGSPAWGCPIKSGMTRGSDRGSVVTLGSDRGSDYLSSRCRFQKSWSEKSECLAAEPL